MSTSRRAHVLSDRPVKAIVVFTHIVGTAVIRALGKMGIPVVAFHYSVCLPNPKVNEPVFVNSIMDLSVRYGGSLLIPTDDYTLVALSKHKKILGAKYLVDAEEWNIVSQCINKQYTYARANAIGISCPKGRVALSSGDLQGCLHDVGLPCVMKPCQGHTFCDAFGVKMLRIANEGELLTQYEKVRKLGIDVMIQELIPGGDAEGVNYNSYFVDGVPIAEFTARKLRLEPPFFGSPRVLFSSYVSEIIEPGRAILRDLRYSGFSCMEFKRDVRDGQYKLMEINCRSNRTGSLAVACGINFPWVMYQHLVHGRAVSCNGFKENVAWIEGTSDVFRFLASRRDERYSLREYIRPYRMENVFAVLSISDPLPFLKRCQYLIGQGLKKIGNRLRGRQR